jgi:hypothetical protein
MRKMTIPRANHMSDQLIYAEESNINTFDKFLNQSGRTEDKKKAIREERGRR